VKQERMAAEEVESLVTALRKSDTLKPLLPWMCRGQRFVFRLQRSGGFWERETWDAENGQPRRWIKLPKPDFAETELFKFLPRLGPTQPAGGRVRRVETLPRHGQARKPL